jgi:hypothetical protein
MLAGRTIMNIAGEYLRNMTVVTLELCKELIWAANARLREGRPL